MMVDFNNFLAIPYNNCVQMIEATMDIVCFMQGHFGDIYGLCASDDPEFTSLVFTAGYDGILCLYDTDKRQPLWKFFLKVRHVSMFWTSIYYTPPSSHPLSPDSVNIGDILNTSYYMSTYKYCTTCLTYCPFYVL